MLLGLPKNRRVLLFVTNYVVENRIVNLKHKFNTGVWRGTLFFQLKKGHVNYVPYFVFGRAAGQASGRADGQILWDTKRLRPFVMCL